MVIVPDIDAESWGPSRKVTNKGTINLQSIKV